MQYKRGAWKPSQQFLQDSGNLKKNCVHVAFRKEEEDNVNTILAGITWVPSKGSRSELFLSMHEEKEFKPPMYMDVKCFKYLGSLLTDDERCTCEIKSRIAMAKLNLTRRRIFLPANWT
jgi:hypothetical protein